MESKTKNAVLVYKSAQTKQVTLQRISMGFSKK